MCVFLTLYTPLSVCVYIIVISQLALAEGLYVLQTQIHSFVNPDQESLHCNQSGCSVACCDNGPGACGVGERRCDTFFIFCLRPFNTEGFAIGGCGSSGSVMQSNVNMDDASLDFSQSSFLGLSNPVRLPGLTNDWNVSW